MNPLASTETRSTPPAPTALTVNGPARRLSARGISVPFATTIVQLPSVQARSSADVDRFIGFTAVGDGDVEGFVGVGEEGDGSAERDGAAGAVAFVPSPESEPHPASVAARARRAQTVPAAPRATAGLPVRGRADDSDEVMGPFYTRVPGRGPERPPPRCRPGSPSEYAKPEAHVR